MNNTPLISLKSTNCISLEGHWVAQWCIDPSWRIYTNFNSGAEVETSSQRIPLIPGEILILPCWQPFRGIVRNPVEHAWLQFNTPQWPSAIAKKHFIEAVRPSSDSLIYRVLMDALGMLREVRLIEAREHLSAQEMAALMGAAYAALAHYIDRFEEPSTQNLEMLQPVVEYIDQHPAADLRIEQLAQTFGWSPGYLSKLFAKEFGMSAGQYIREARITIAADLLLQAELSLEQIASQCGFSHRHHFTRVFTSIMGIPPATYRKQQLVVS